MSEVEQEETKPAQEDPAKEPNMIEARGLVKTYGVKTVVNGASLDIGTDSWSRRGDPGFRTPEPKNNHSLEGPSTGPTRHRVFAPGTERI